MLNDVRCGSCSRLLAKASRFDEIQIKCPRCGTLNNLKAMSLLAAPMSATSQEQHHGPTHHPVDRRQTPSR
ncbi:MAG: Com family DNA-binding transcriptional regulator [Paraperlucidibaca sp.]|nr:Com family DNA-binding transcriptional regulator [Paraperlucidibaca sp.]MBQ0722317.1 Com family DNA-binding transcriptional regulator [Paraperlucidibaca sp.]